MSLILVLVLFASEPASAGYSPTGCSFVSARGANIVAYADTKIGDEGDVLASFLIAPGERSPPVEPRAGKLRYKYRTNKFDSWTYSYTVDCSSNHPVQLP